MADWMAKGNQRKVRKKDKGKGSEVIWEKKKNRGAKCGYIYPPFSPDNLEGHL